MRSTRAHAPGALWISRILGMLAAGCFGLAVTLWFDSEGRQEAVAALSPRTPIMDADANPQQSINLEDASAQETTPTEEDWEGAQETFPGLASWLDVAGTEVSSPVMQATSDNPNWYLDHDATGAYDASGLPYLDCHSSAADPVRVIYGHNLGWGTEGRFGSLANRWQPNAFAELGWASWSVPGEPTRTFAPLCAFTVPMSATETLGLGTSEEEVSSWLTGLLNRINSPDDTLVEGTQASYASTLVAQAKSALVLVTCTGDAFPSEQRTVVVFVEPAS